MAPTVHIAAPAERGLRADREVTTEQLLRALRNLPAGHPDREPLRARAIEANLPLANRLAQRYAGRGERPDDLAQVAALALVKAVDGYDPDRLAPFASYAVPTIVGALKRHFRDTAWGMRVPRTTQELVLGVREATGDLEQLRGRTPTAIELAAHLRVDVDVLSDAIIASQVYRLQSLNGPCTGNDGTEPVDLIGRVDPRFARIDERLSHGELGRLVAALPLRERRILAMRFSDEMTQAAIAAELGISQMHVSRLLRGSLNRLRVGLLTSVEPTA
ncbi:sigma-70 family RNA polymerase sigma factor [Dactylosporangium sp. NPDC049742]|uniref:sigma-70 family RNA polymerase sigma factor n=1 Tax=Dactylosporangium sp. NPDC049742 TaxID=3154737 RepID=UPI003414E832